MLAPGHGSGIPPGRRVAALDRAMPLLVLAGAIALLACVLLSSPAFIHSDSAAAILLAEQLLRSGSLLTPDWIYVSDSLTLDGRIQLAMLGTAIWGASTPAYVCMVAAGALFCLFSCLLLCRQFEVDRWTALAVSIAMLLGPSYIYQDIVLGLAVSVQIAWALLLVHVSLRFLAGSGAALWLALAIVLLSAVSSPKKALAYYLLPAVGALVLNGAFAHWAGIAARNAMSRRLVLAAALVAGWIAGYCLHAWALDGLSVNKGYAKFAQTLSPGRLLENARLVGVLSARFMGQGNSLGHAASVVACGLAALGAATIPWQAGNARRFFGSPVGLAYLFAMAGIGTILAYLLTYEEIKPHYGIYYLLIPGALIAAVVAWAAGSGAATTRHPWIAQGAVAALLVLGIVNAASLQAGLPRDYRGIGRNQHTTDEERRQVVRWLQDHGATHGFANFWDANAMTLLSRGRLQVGSILTPVTGGMQRHGWLVDKARRDYVPSTGDRWFIALPTRLCGVKLPAACAAASDADMTVGAYRVLTFTGPAAGCAPTY